jgi:uncharacterized protein YjeT (DUF2065 family)
LNLIRVIPAKGQDRTVPTSIFLAKLIGPIVLVAAVGLFLNAAAYRAMAQEFLRNPALLYLSGLLTLTAGVAIVLAHNVWVARWPVLITILGWLAAIGGALRILLPERARRLGEAMLRKPLAMQIGGAIWLAVGALLCFFGYVR